MKIISWCKAMLFAAAFLQIAVTATAQTGTNGVVQLIQGYGQVPLRFEPNVGQTESQVRYLSRGNGYTMYFLPTEVALALDVSTNANPIGQRPSPFASESRRHQLGLVHFKFEGANPNAVISAEQTLPEKINYFIGSDPSQWHTSISAYGQVRYQNIYPGVDLEFYGNQNQLEYDFVIAPHANVKAIRLKLAGADHVEIEPNGDLAFSVQGRTTHFQHPVVYQTINGIRHDIVGGYRLNGNIVSFNVGAYDHAQPLIIDPVLSYSSFLGGTAADQGWGVSVDASGNAYVCGQTLSILTNILTVGALQTNFGGGGTLGDAFVAKIGSGGTNAVFITYLGGNQDDVALGIAADHAGNTFVAGYTDSPNFPVTPGALYTNIAGVPDRFVHLYPVDGFVTELNPGGSNLIFSTYLGGEQADGVYGIAVDSSDNAYVTGFTSSTNFPTTNAIQKHLACPYSIYYNNNAFVTEIASNGTSLVYSTYYGGTNFDWGYGIAVDGAGDAYVTGFTQSTNFPTTNAISSTLSGAQDAFVFKLGPGGTNRLYSTYLGGTGSATGSGNPNSEDGIQGSGSDAGNGIDVDVNGNAYVVGQTFSTNFPTTNALQTVLNGSGNATICDAFMTKLSSSGQMIYSTFLGGSQTDVGYGVKAQADGSAVIVGQTGSIDFAPYNNYGSINSGLLDGFVAKLSSDGQVLMNFAYLGGSAADTANAVALDSQNNAYVVGTTASTNYPVTSTNVVQPTYGGGSSDAFITKLYFVPNQLGTKVVTAWQASNAWSVIGPPATLAASNTWSSANLIPSISSNGVTSLVNTRLQRGVSYDPTYTSFIIPLNQQTGFRLDDLGNNSGYFGGSFPWFTRLQCDTRTHLSLVSSTNVSGVSTNYYGYVTNFNNPIAAFGATAGGSPLYVNEQFQFGVYCGAQYESTNSDGTVFQSPLRILVYNLSSFTNGQTNLVAPIATNYIAIPRRTIAADSTNWLQFSTNGFSVTINTNGLRTIVQLVAESGGAWGVVPQFTNAQSGTYLITEECTTNMGYGYVLEGIGVVPLSTNLYPMVTNTAGVAWDRLYSLDFQTRPPWRSVFIDQPQFNGTPLPSFYQGASLSELTNLNAVVTNIIVLTNSVYSAVDDSPELRRHPMLDQLVANLNNDPIALANYVVNNIDLCDALAYNLNNGQASASAVNEGGVNRSALDVYLEGQGSPVEQCALLVYLLRQAGYPAAYVFPTNNNVLMLDTRLSALLRMQLHGAINQFGQLYTSNTLITVNYPWVVTTISNQTVHIFPWLKDTCITEGLNLYDYMPTNYNSGFKWLQNYLYGDTNILNLSAESDAPSVLFPRFVKTQLLTNAPGIALDDLGVSAYNRQHYYLRWQDFPTPSVVNNPTQVVCVDSLASPAITNVSPALTNIFDTVTLTVYSQNNPTNTMTIGPLRMADLQNREMFMATNSAGNMMLWLAPYILGNTNQGSFSPTDTTLTNIQVATIPVATNDTLFDIHMTHFRHQAINFSPGSQFLNVSETLQFTTPDRPFNVNDIAAVCFNVGRVTPAMIDVHAQAFQQMTYQWSLNTNTIPAVQDYQGAAAYMMGMDYYSHVSAFLPVCEQLHKAQVVSWYAEGISRLTPVPLGAQNFMRPSMDMFYSEMAHAGNGTSHPDSGTDPLAGTDDFSSIMDGEIAAQEHGIINGYYQSQNAVSSVVLLRLAQQRQTNGVSGIIELNKNNYLAVGATNAPGYGPTKLMNYDATIWAAVTNAFTGWDADYVRAYITPGPVSVQAANYRGMGLVVVGKSQSASVISVNMNGVLGQPSLYFGSTPASLSTAYAASSPMDTFSTAYSLDASASYGANYYGYYGSGGDLYYGGSALGGSDFSYYWSTPDWFGSSLNFWPYEMPVSQYQIIATFTPPSQVNLSQQINDLYNFPQSTPVTTSLTHALDSGNTGTPVWKNQVNYTYEPVNVMSGEFYEDTMDLTVAGPMPLQLRRNYSSQNQDDRNGFGYGWNINVVAYITIATNATTNIVLNAVELDGSVIAYRQQTGNTNLFLPTTADNPQLDNFGNGRIGSIHNPFNAKIVYSTNGTNQIYTLTQADGQVRTYVVNSFPVSTPTNTIYRTRPYLATWQDTQGNSWAFLYGTNSALPNYGSVIRINCSNGNYLGLDYNAAGYVVDAYTSDGEKVAYQYDDFGDLVLAVRADQSEETYEYQHIQYTNNGTVYVDSTHLLINDFKPDGRVVQNLYDNQRRVSVQLATIGPDLNVYTNAVFTYANNFALTNAWTNHISGYTTIKDVNGNTVRYDYTNSLVTTNTDQLGQQVIQIWYADNATSPGYPRSLYQTRDKRGLWTQFQYDSNGNATNVFSWGDLTGDGTTQYATNSASYNSNNLPVLLTGPVGNSVQTVYQTQYPYLPQYVIYAPGGTPTITNQFTFGSVTNVIVNGNLTLTNMAFGLPLQQIRAVNSPDAATNQWSFDGRGYLTQSVQFTGTGDPAVTNYFTCNNQGEIIERTDAAGQRTDFGYDDMRRPIAHEVFAAGQTAPMFWEFAYYTENGELQWYEGPRYNPMDYQWFDYDGAGRPITQIKWRAEAKSDGTGVQAPAGYNLYAQSFNQFDKFNNLTLSVDPRGAMTTNSWDKIGQLLRQQHLDTNGVTVLSSEGFAYEPGGLVSAYTNALGGVTSTAYTTNGLPKYRSNPDGSTNAWRYYLDGRINKKIQSNGAYWQTTYDDVNRIITRVFYSALNVPLATNSIQLDRRGNVVQRVDEGGNVFTNAFDGLDRVKYSLGPAIVTITQSSGGGTGGLPGTNIYYVTNITQQAFTNFFDAAGQVLTNVNALGENAVTWFDPIGRPVANQIFSASSTLVRETYLTYSPDYHSVTVTQGSGSTAISHTYYTDNDGNNVLSVAYPSTGTLDYTRNHFDLAGNLDYQEHDSPSGSLWAFASYSFDGLNRPTQKIDRDDALTTYAYNPMGEITNQVLPGSLQWNATYNNAGQMLKDWNMGGSSGTRTNSYIYYSSGNVFAGLLNTRTDGRGVVCTYTYDDWLRLTNAACTGSLAEQNLTTAWQYEPRGYVTQINEQFASTNTGPATSIQRSFDPYGQLSSESVSAGTFSYGAGQNFDAAGRRSILSIGSATYGFGWQADGHLTFVDGPTGDGSYTFDTAGLLTSRFASPRQTTISSRDGEGRPFSITTTVNSQTVLTESLSYYGDGSLAYDTLYRSDFTDSRSYAYANLSRRLTYEQLNLNGSTVWTNNFNYDNGFVAGPGVLTRMGAPNTTLANWSGVADAFSRVNAETNNTFAYPAYGHVNGQATLSAWLDGQSVPITATGTNAMQWRATMELSAGTHQLKVSALHPSGFYTAWATNSFTNNIAYESTADTFDPAGYITNRVWKNPSGTVERTQTLSWDARGRLHAVTERDASNSGYNWSAVYDGLGRRLSTTTTLVTNGVVYASSSQTLNSYFDPQVKFLELGVQNGSQTTYKLYGPDLDGTYGGENGMGGLDAVSPYLNLFDTTISDARGDILGYYDPTQGSVTWNPSRPTGYGAVPGYRPAAFGSGANMAQASAWRGRWPDITGYLHLGARDYDPIAGMWLSYDPLWNAGDPNGYSFTGGDPVNRTDPNGKCVENKPPVYYMGIAPEMQASLQTTVYFNNGHSVTTGGPDQPAVMYDPNQVGGRSYNVVVQPTGRSFFYISKQPLPANYGQTTVTPITKWDVQLQEDKQFLIFSAVVLSTVATDTERFAPELLGANRLSVAETSLTAANRALRLPATDASLTGTRTLGYTTPSGDVFLQPGLSRAEQLSTLQHESVHAFFSPEGNGAIATFRQNLGQWGYENSAFLNATEEIVAQTRATGNLSQGMSHAFSGAYTVRGGIVVTPWNFLGEGAIGIGTVGGLGVGSYYLGNNLFGGQ